MLSNYLITCNHSSSEVERHECCSCEQHEHECENHAAAVDHDCVRKYSLSLEYIAPSNKSASSSNSASHYPTDVVAVSAIFADRFIEYISLFTPWLDEDLIHGYNPSAGLLRAPPAFV